MTKKPNPLHVEVVEHAEPYVALVLYAAQTFEAKDPQFARQLVEAARYVEGLMLNRDTARGAFADIAFSADMTLKVARHKAKRLYVLLDPAAPSPEDAADRREPRR